MVLLALDLRFGGLPESGELVTRGDATSRLHVATIGGAIHVPLAELANSAVRSSSFYSLAAGVALLSAARDALCADGQWEAKVGTMLLSNRSLRMSRLM